jgi:DNA-binding response OmpR family regulator
MKKILIVSNLSLFIKKEKNFLTRANLEIVTARTGLEALKILHSGGIHLVVADLDIPDMAGDELCAQIRINDALKSISIIMVCKDTGMDRTRCENSGANAYVTRPIEAAALIEKISQLLNVPQRKSYRVLLKVTVDGKFLNESFYCYSQNLSASGILLETDKELSDGDTINCSFFLPGSLRIIAEGEVVRFTKKSINTFHYGIKFINLNTEQESAIKGFIQKRAETQES